MEILICRMQRWKNEVFYDVWSKCKGRQTGGLALCAAFRRSCLYSFSNSAQKWPWLPDSASSPTRKKMGLLPHTLEFAGIHEGWCMAPWKRDYDIAMLPGNLPLDHLMCQILLYPPLLRFNQQTETVCYEMLWSGTSNTWFYQMAERGQCHSFNIFFFSISTFFCSHVSFFLLENINSWVKGKSHMDGAPGKNF